MKRKFLYVSLIVSLYLFPCCHQSQSSSSSKNDSASQVHYSSDDIPEFRKQVKKEAVAVYKEKTDDPLNDWYFSVRLFETEKTFRYLLKMQFEEIKGEDTLKLPNFGIDPKPELRKGKD